MTSTTSDPVSSYVASSKKSFSHHFLLPFALEARWAQRHSSSTSSAAVNSIPRAPNNLSYDELQETPGIGPVLVFCFCCYCCWFFLSHFTGVMLCRLKKLYNSELKHHSRVNKTSWREPDLKLLLLTCGFIIRYLCMYHKTIKRQKIKDKIVTKNSIFFYNRIQ